MRVGMPWSPQEVRSKGCKFCGKRVYYNMAKHEWCDDPDLKIRHDDKDKWRPSPNQDVQQIILDKVSDIQWKQDKMYSIISELRLKINEALERTEINV